MKHNTYKQRLECSPGLVGNWHTRLMSTSFKFNFENLVQSTLVRHTCNSVISELARFSVNILDTIINSYSR
jgi:hypothetical protein